MKLFDRSKLQARRALSARAHFQATGFRALGAYPNDGRANATASQVGETMRTTRERVQLMWNALELIDNSGLAESILGKLGQYVAGMLRYQARTGDKHINQAYEDDMKEGLGPAIDITGRFSLREMLTIGVRGCAVKGGVGLDLVRPEPDSKSLKLRGIEYDRIGNPYNFGAERFKVGGVHIDHLGREVAFDIFNRDRVGGMYSLAEVAPKFNPLGQQEFFHLFRPGPGGFDGYKGRTAFTTAIDDVHYLDQIRKFELQAQHWAAAQSGVYFTENKELPGGIYDVRQDGQGNTQRTFAVTPNEIQALGTGERLEMFKNDRPSANVQAMWLNVVRMVALSVGLPFIFIYDEDGGGPGVRFAGAQADRTIREWWQMFDERLLIPFGQAYLANRIYVEKALPWHPRWRSGMWLGPKAPSIDTGYDSAAILNEMAEGVRSGAGVAAERGEDIDEIHDQKEIEADGLVERAQRIATKRNIPFSVALSLLHRGQNAQQGTGGVATQAEAEDPEEAGATTEGALMP